MTDEIPYGENALQTIKLFEFLPENENSLILIHGGAWRDPNNTFLDFSQLVGHLTLENTNLIGINYRLSPEFKHPSHLIDTVNAISKILTVTKTNKVLFLGHSVGATLLLQLLNYKEIICLGNLRNSEIKIPDLILDIDKIFLLDGIYNIVDLIDEYGAPYKLFVDCAFESKKHYEDATQITWLKRKFSFEFLFSAVVLQSLEDELLSERQSLGFVEFLKKYNVSYEYLTGNWGKHEESYTRRELADIITSRI